MQSIRPQAYLEFEITQSARGMHEILHFLHALRTRTENLLVHAAPHRKLFELD
jgi:hypothetical protein